ncbi:MAG: endonuclease/exonuclease/phosphatase family protein [Haloarculaceae archaeon]
MSEEPPTPPALTRRAVLGSAAGLAALPSVAGGSGATRAPATPTVLTRNAYLGVDLFRLFRAESSGEFRRIAGRLLEGVEPDRYAVRADAIAAEIAATDAEVVALQEVVLLRTQRPGDFGSESAVPASDVLVDLLSLVESALADRDLDYETVAVATTTDVELPADTGEGQVDVRLTDRDVLLVRGDVETGEAVTDTYATSLPVPLPGSDRTLALERGYCSVEVRMDGVGFAAVSTHLESVSPLARRQQAAELLEALPADRPVVVGGDFNSGPGTDTAAYDRLTADLDDAYATLDPGGEGYTCCQAGSLRNESSRLDRRIDALLYRGRLDPTAVGRVGHRPEDRVEVAVDGETVRIWPSDHAGVVGTFEVAEPTPTPTSDLAATPTPATSTPTATGTPTATPTPRTTPTGSTPAGTTDGSGPGMGVLAAVVGLSAAVVARLRRD